ncbi:MAG: cell wall metabolism sensor histidine kinase WalK [Ruminococcaceae bacterium]|nr:cell wall metabolism sensor histidine kinase WalK [Oscillospiraceae bacterium]
MVTILKKFNASFLNIRLKIGLTYLIIILVVLVVLSSFLLSTLYSYLFDQKKVDVLTNANIIANIVSEDFTEAYISEKLPHMPLEKNARAIVVNTESTVLFDSYKETSIKGKTFINSAITAALLKDGKNSSNAYKENGSWFIDAAVPVIKNAKTVGAVYVIQSGDSTEDIISHIRNALFMLGGLIIVFVGIFSASMARILTLPIERFTKFINNMPKDSLQHVEVSSRDEIGQLAIAFNSLIDRMAELEEKRRAFVSNASHELKTPLSIIKLLSDSLIQTENPDPEFIREFLSDMNKEVERLTRIIERLLDMTQMDSSQQSMQFVHTDVREIAQEVFDKLVPLARSKEIDVTLTTPEEEVILPIERDTLTEAVYNIADNSIKYTETGGNVSISVSRDLGNVYIAVSDTGIGIPKEEIQKIFDRFYRVDKARARETGGTGLGLSIALDAVKLHNGHIEVISEEEAGSRFTISLPYSEEYNQ